MQAITQTAHWTYEDMVKNLPAESQYELRDFNLIEMPSPKPKHQRIVTNVYDLVKPFIKAQNLGILFVAPLDVVFQKGDVAQPDLIFIATDSKHIVKESHITGAPDLLVEVVSKGSVARDYIEKRNDYQKFGVKEYWIIDSLNGLSHILWTGQTISAESTARNAVFYGDKAIDRSPCGTGTSARMAQWAAKGKLKKGDVFVHESIIGSQFVGRVEDVVQVGDLTAIVPSVQGWAKVYGHNTITIDTDDPYCYGFQVI
jgi:Uma2 family endonuclease